MPSMAATMVIVWGRNDGGITGSRSPMSAVQPDASTAGTSVSVLITVNGPNGVLTVAVSAVVVPAGAWMRVAVVMPRLSRSVRKISSWGRRFPAVGWLPARDAVL